MFSKINACRAGEVVLALIASEAPVSTLHAMMLTAVGTGSIILPTYLCECLPANLLTAEMADD